MYKFPEEVVEAAIAHYTIQQCGEFDELFYFQASADCISRPAIEICIVMDFLDEKYKALYQSSSEQFDQHFKSSSDRDGMAS